MTTSRDTATTTAWARVRLTAGESSEKLWDISSDTREARVDIGASSVCSWIIRAEGVAPRHVELFWNGTTLWVGNATRDDSVRIDGKTFSEWHEVKGTIRLEFGSAAMLVEAKNESAVLAATTDLAPDTARSSDPKVTSWDNANDATIVHAEAALPRPSQAHYSPAPSSGGSLQAPRIPPVPKRSIPAPPPPSRKPNADAAARLANLLPIDTSKPQAYAEASTEIRPDLAPPIASPVTGQLASFEEETRFPVERPVPAPVPAPAVHSVVTHSRPAPSIQTAEQPENPFAPPPPPEAEPAVKAFQQLTEKLQAIRTSQKLSVPFRTWALLFAVVIMGSYALAVVRQKRLAEEAAAAPRAASVAEERRAPPPSVEPTGAQAGSGDIADLARRGAATLFAGRLAEALPIYRELASRDSRNPAYGVVIRGLERRLGICANGATSCAP